MTDFTTKLTEILENPHYGYTSSTAPYPVLILAAIQSLIAEVPGFYFEWEDSLDGKQDKPDAKARNQLRRELLAQFGLEGK